MPRDKVVTMGKLTGQQIHDAAIDKNIKLYSPFEVVAGALVGVAHPWAVVYVAPRVGTRYIAGLKLKRNKATKLRDALNKAWAEGFLASGQTE